MRVPYASGEYLRFDHRGYAWCADTRILQLSQYRLGDSVPVRVLRAAAEPAVVTAAERDSAVERANAFMAKAGTASLDFSLIPQTKPLLQAIDFDDQGRVWVRADTKFGPRAIVFDGSGNLIGQATLAVIPVGWTPLIIRRGRLHAVVSDSLGVPTVAVLRVAFSTP